jgi:PII-like signaling protein
LLIRFKRQWSAPGPFGIIARRRRADDSCLTPFGLLQTMEIPREAVLLRIFIGENRRYHRLPLYEAIVLKAREMHLAGATVLRGPMGFGKSSRLHAAKRFKISTDLPIVVELVDSREKIEAFLPVIDGMIDSGLATIERAEVMYYSHDPPKHR